MGREREPERAVGPFVCGIEFGASLLEVRYSRLVLGELRWARVGIRGLRALIGVRGQQAGGNGLGTRRSLARMPPNNPCTTHGLAMSRIPSTLIPELRLQDVPACRF